ncbi:MAG: 4Fe-4S dicluster domain-containing protein [Clostridiaceae bacterium]|nr:4Fe-4S dicluster domain-containing protein [Clostridiaceae bacterium]
MKRVYAIEKNCIDCKLCEVYCKTAHSRTKDIIKAHKTEQPEPQARILVEGDHLLSCAVSCRHCDDPACVAACITGAMVKDPVTGIVTNDPDRCIGCMTCLAACPYGVVKVGTVAFKCDLCQGEEEPACVAHCPNRALIYVEGGSLR